MLNPFFAVFQRYSRRRHGVVQREIIDVESKKMTAEATAADRHMRGHVAHNNNIRPRSAKLSTTIARQRTYWGNCTNIQ